MRGALVGILGGLFAVSAYAGQAPSGRGAQAPGPSVTVNGQTWTQQSLFQRNVGGPDDMNWITCSVHLGQVMFGSWMSASNVCGDAGRV